MKYFAKALKIVSCRKTNIMKHLLITAIALSLCLLSCKEKVITVQYENGNKYEEYQYTGDSLKNGYYNRYAMGGVLLEESTYRDGYQDGVRKLYTEDGVLEVEENYSNKKLNGPYTVYHTNGNKKIEAVYTDDVLKGIVKVYYPSGALKEEVTYEDNIENGPFKEYHENGQLLWKGTYKDGDNEFGLLEKYDTNGVVVRKMMCDDRAICRTTWTSEKEDS